jgi:hypothetical protein
VYSSSILTSTKLLYLTAGAALLWACAKGVEIAEDVVYLSPQPVSGRDAGADAGVVAPASAAAQEPTRR